MKAKTARLLSVLAFANSLSFSSAICYYPNGDPSPQDVPCSDGTDHSTCCGPGYACLSNNICMATGLEKQIPNAAKYDRGSCTDKTWRSSECPNFCVNAANGDTLNGGIGIAKCPGNLDMYYCMDGAQFNCKDGDNVLSFSGSPTALTTIGFVPTSTSSTSTTPTPSSSSSSSATSTSTSSSSSTSTTPTPSSSTTSPAAASPPADAVNQSSSSPPIGLIAGLAVGISVGVLGLAAAAFMAYRRHQTKKKLRSAAQPPPFQDFPYGNTSVHMGAEHNKAYYPMAFSQPTAVFELSEGRPRTPELSTGYK